MSYRQVTIMAAMAIAVVMTAGCFTGEDQVAKTIETFWPDGSVKERFEVAMIDTTDDTVSVKDGNYRSWYESGHVHKEGQFVRGKKSGGWTFRHDSDDSALLMAGTFVEDAMHGEWRWWMPASHNLEHASMKMSARDDSQSIHASGMPPPHKIANYDQGLLHGLSISWHSSGAVADSFNYHYGVLEGVYVSYHQNGTRAALGVYSNGLLVDSMQIWDSLGLPVR